jgi:hypothetical protein
MPVAAECNLPEAPGGVGVPELVLSLILGSCSFVRLKAEPASFVSLSLS